ncbi:hypothetical protein [Bradyrhizobium sp. BR 1432]|uniref:hypothetical protein n=1 Tax=Bradyrhizobium sp. BR 1432 TaxID=3447966 RepID=UPI003EE6F4D6
MLTPAAFPSIGEPTALLWAFLSNVYLWGGVACYAIGMLFWLAVLSTNEASVAYPML